jgi:hypothetical protein
LSEVLIYDTKCIPKRFSYKPRYLISCGERIKSGLIFCLADDDEGSGDEDLREFSGDDLPHSFSPMGQTKGCTNSSLLFWPVLAWSN